MEVVLCDISAWQYWRTPPIIRDFELDPYGARDALADDRAERIIAAGRRLNVRAPERILSDRLFTDLKGLSLPVHVALPEGASMHHSDIVRTHRLPRHLPAGWLTDLGGGLKVYAPELTCAIHHQPRSLVAISKMMYEACGIFSLCPSNERIDLAIAELRNQGVLVPGKNWGDSLLGYSDGAGKPIASHDRQGAVRAWLPWFAASGQLNDMWKRPAITNTERIGEVLAQLHRVRGTATAAKAISTVINGAASPAEVQACIMLFTSRRLGGEGRPVPELNRQIHFSEEARQLTKQTFCIADCLWPASKKILEVNGESAHGESMFSYRREQERKAALESMGYTVADILPAQMVDLVAFDALLPVLAEKLEMPLVARTPAFLGRRTKLHTELFGAPYGPH